MLKKLFYALAVVSLGILVAVAVDYLGDYSQRHWLPSRDQIAAVLFTVATLYAVAVQFRRQWRMWKFWAALSLITVLHCIAYALILWKFPDLHLLFFPAIAIGETPLICSVLFAVGFGPSS